nr:hypothetical protein [Tanacetum cinerariifolium]
MRAHGLGYCPFNLISCLFFSGFGADVRCHWLWVMKTGSYIYATMMCTTHGINCNSEDVDGYVGYVHDSNQLEVSREGYSEVAGELNCKDNAYSHCLRVDTYFALAIVE